MSIGGLGVSTMSLELPRVITKRELRQIVPYTPQHILRLEKLGRFPKRIRFGERRVGWLLSDVETWIATRKAAGPSNASGS